jgi:hypothetical protein
MNQPDTLKNSLIRMRRGQGQRRVIRDDGANGLWISHPTNPAQMYQISRDEFDSNWEIEKSGDQQNTQDLSNVKWGRMGQPTENIRMNSIETINTPRIEVKPVEPRKNEGFDGGRSEETDREAMKQEILGQPVLDADFSGDPVAANEESVSTFEPDRAMSEADAEAAEAREEELSGQFQEFEPQDEGGDDAPAPEAPADEPTAGNEDPDSADEMEAEAGDNPNASDAAGATKAEKDAAKAAKKAENDAAKAKRRTAKGA